MVELWDVLDKEGNKTGKIIERGQQMESDEYFLIVDVWIMNGNGEFLISKRAPTANPEPNRWQPTTGCAIAGEDSITAAVREAKEELGITLKEKNGKMIKRYIAWDKAFIDVWLFKQEIDINKIILQPEETAAAQWATNGIIKKLYASNEFLSESRMFYLNEFLQDERVNGATLKIVACADVMT